MTPLKKNNSRAEVVTHTDDTKIYIMTSFYTETLRNQNTPKPKHSETETPRDQNTPKPKHSETENTPKHSETENTPKPKTLRNRNPLNSKCVAPSREHRETQGV